MTAEATALLRRRGIQVTAQRLAVLRVVSSHPHITADAVAEAVRADIGAISLQSVYDALNVLVAEKILRRIQPAGSAARYEDRVGYGVGRDVRMPRHRAENGEPLRGDLNAALSQKISRAGRHG